MSRHLADLPSPLGEDRAEEIRVRAKAMSDADILAFAEVEVNEVLTALSGPVSTPPASTDGPDPGRARKRS